MTSSLGATDEPTVESSDETPDEGLTFEEVEVTRPPMHPCD